MTRALPPSIEAERRAAAALIKQFPVTPKRCVNHPSREATVWSAIGDEPGADLCDECFEARSARAGPA